MGHDNEKETEFLTSISKYGVSNDSHFTVQIDNERLMCMEHVNFIIEIQGACKTLLP